MGKTAVRMGHMKDVDQGAVGIIKEYDTIREYAPYVINSLLRSGDEAHNVTPASAYSTADSLCQGVDKANNIGADCFVSCHVNSFNSDANGCLVLYYPGSVKGKALAESIVKEIAALGFRNQGARADTRGLYELKATNAPAVIVEPFFCSNAQDVELYKQAGPQKLGEAIAKGILNWKGMEFVPEVEKAQKHWAKEDNDELMAAGYLLSDHTDTLDNPASEGMVIALFNRLSKNIK